MLWADTGKVGGDDPTVPEYDIRYGLSEQKSCGGYVSVGIGIFNLFRDYKMKFPKSQATLTIIGTVILIVLCQMVWVGGVQPGGVVLCILLFNTPVESYVSYALYRILDTTIGVLIAWAVSYVFPRGWMQMWKERIEALKAR